MIRHIVMWKLKDNALSSSKIENAVKLKNLLINLKHDIKEIKSITVDIDSSNIEDNYDIILTADFDSFEDLNTYQNHPKHVEVAKFVSEIRLSRACIDYKI